METAKENGGSFSVDLNDNEEGRRGGAVKPGHRPCSVLKDRSLALLAGVTGGRGAVRSRSYATRTERNVNSEDPEMLVAADGSLAGRFVDSCVISGVCGGLNGFSESLGPDDLEAGEGEGGGLASCPAVLGDLVSSQMLQEEEGGETPECFASGGGGCIRTSTPRDRLSCPAKLQQICSEVGLSCPRGNMPNGVVDSPGCGSPEGDMKLLATRILGQKLGLCDGEEVKVANGGLHIFNPACEWTGSGFDPVNRDSETRQGKEPGWGQEDLSGQLHLLYQEQETSSAAEPPHSPTPESSANPPSPCPASPFNVNRDSSVSDPSTQEENFRDLCPPIRPQSLRTNPNISVSLSCDATPLSPDEDGGFYFDQEGYEEDLRTVLDSGRRQSAPDPLSEQTDCQDHKVMPKRFGIADFFTR